VESLGYKLKTAREGKGIGFEQAGKDTKISIRYLEALEKEDFSSFPGEAYIIGFLRNYGAYLDLDVSELLTLYRAILQQEQPIPVEQLLKQPSPVPKIVLKTALIVMVLGIIFGGLYSILSRPKNTGSVVQSRAAAGHIMSGDTFEGRFFIGDTILIPSGLDPVRMELQELGETVIIQSPGGPVFLDLGVDKYVDLGGGTGAVRISALDFDRNNPHMGVRLRFVLVGTLPQAEPEDESFDTAVLTGQIPSVVIITSPNAYPFTLQSHFQGYCMFRWEILAERDRRERQERYFQRSEELNIQANNGIRIWMSNAQAAKFQIIGGGRTYPLEIGAAGEVVVADIRWVRDEENRFRLILARLET